MVHPSFLMNKFQTNYNPIIRYISNFRIKILQPLNQKLSSLLADFYLNLYFRRYNFTQLGTQCQRKRYTLDILHNFGHFVSLNFQSSSPRSIHRFQFLRASRFNRTERSKIVVNVKNIYTSIGAGSTNRSKKFTSSLLYVQARPRAFIPFLFYFVIDAKGRVNNSRWWLLCPHTRNAFPFGDRNTRTDR